MMVMNKGGRNSVPLRVGELTVCESVGGTWGF